MILFHIWLGSPIPEKYAENISLNHALLLPTDRHILISDYPHPDCEQELPGDVVARMKQDERFGRLLTDYTKMAFALQLGRCNNFPNQMATSDIMRLYFANENPECGYCDCDCLLYSRFNFFKDKTVFGTDFAGKKDIFLFANGEGSEAINSLVDILTIANKRVRAIYDIVNSVDLDKMVGAIDSGHYKHEK